MNISIITLISPREKEYLRFQFLFRQKEKGALSYHAQFPLILIPHLNLLLSFAIILERLDSFNCIFSRNHCIILVNINENVFIIAHAKFFHIR